MTPGRLADILGSMGQAPARIADFVAAADADPALAAKIADAAEAGDNRALMRLMAEQQWSRAPSRVVPDAPPPPASRSPMSFDDRVANDPNIRRAIEESGGQVPVGDTEGTLAAYRSAVPAEDAIRALIPPPPPARQLELPLPDDPGRGLTPYGVRGPGVPVGGPGGAGVTVPGPTDLSTFVTPRRGLPEPPRGLPEPPRGLPEPPRQLPPPRRMALEAPGVAAARNAEMDEASAMDDLAQAVERDRLIERLRLQEAAQRNGAEMFDRAVRRQPPAPPRRNLAGPLAGGAAAGGGAVFLMNQAEGPERATGGPRRPLVPNVTRPPRPMSTADLAAQTAPPPVVQTQEDAPITLDYAQMARDKIRQANEIQLREGRITPESAALSREADALYLKAAEARRTGNHPPIMPVEQQNDQTSAIKARARRELAENPGGDPRSEARRIMSMLNAGQIPPAQREQAKAEMKRLFAAADQQDNARRHAG